MKIPEQPTPNLIIVKNIGKETTEQTLRDFFAFCGKIKDFEVQPDGDKQKALILFESSKAANTAELLSNALVENSHIEVERYFKETGTEEQKRTTEASQAAASGVPLVKDDAETKKQQQEAPHQQDQDKKTVSNIMAELLSYGYGLSDQILAKGVEYDHKYGVRDTVQRYFDQVRHNLQQWNEQYHVSDKASEMEQRIGLQQKQKEATEKAQEWLQNTPAGQKVSGLITQFSQQISDLHNEAKRLVSTRQTEAQSKASSA